MSCVVRVIADVNLLKDVMVSALFPLAGNLVLLGAMVAVMTAMQWQLGLVAAAVVPLLALSTVRLGRRIREGAREQRRREGSLARFVWRYAPASPKRVRTKADVPATSAESVALSKELKARGWRFVGPTTCYAFFQAMGLVNDHLEGCARMSTVAALRTQALSGLTSPFA